MEDFLFQHFSRDASIHEMNLVAILMNGGINLNNNSVEMYFR